jgi:predicted anti-sigma-YlaC factor YlaD
LESVSQSKALLRIMIESGIESERRRSRRTVQITFAVLSLTMLLLGLAINWFAVQVGLSHDIVNAAAFGMLLAGVAHALALWLWAR